MQVSRGQSNVQDLLQYIGLIRSWFTLLTSRRGEYDARLLKFMFFVNLICCTQRPLFTTAEAGRIEWGKLDAGIIKIHLQIQSF